MDNNEREACNAGGESSSGQEHVEDYDTLAFRHRLHVPSPLTPEAEQVMTETIGAAIAVHRVLGLGFLESIYRRRCASNCIRATWRTTASRPISVSYRGVAIGGQRVDLIVEGLIVVELKAVARLHRSQPISYLRTLNLRGGLLINFHVPYLKQGLRRVVCEVPHASFVPSRPFDPSW